MRLELLYDDEVVHTHEVGQGPLHIGRAPVNHMVLRERDVSGHHAVVWSEGAGLWFEDLGSTNGSWFGDERLVGRRRLAVGDVVRLGQTTRLRVGVHVGDRRAPLVLEGEDGRLSWGVTGPRFALPVDGDAVLWLDEPGGAALVVDGATRVPVAIDAPFEAFGQRFVLRRVVGPVSDTLRGTDHVPDHTLHVRLDDSVAVITGPSGITCTVRTEHRVALLYTLGRRWRDDAPGPGRGWMDDEDVVSAVWGRSRRQRGPNALNVLVHRLRASLDGASMDRRFLEKRPGGVRLVAAAVEIG